MKKSLLLLIVFSFSFCALWAQTKISGIVTDAGNGAPIGYATVAVKGTAVGVTTDAKGAYTIPIPKGTQNVTLVFSYVGYDPQEVAVGNRTKIDIALKSSSVDIDEVVVTGYQNLKKQTFTGSSVKLNASDLNVAGTSDISRMLEGKAAGVSVQNVSGTFGAAPKVRIRGVASITGDNKPLWVVDGVVLEDMVNVSNDQLSSGDPTTLLGSSVAGINAEDIETFDILKDAAATAMYGARAMNGVIVITTKRGKSTQLGEPIVRYHGDFTIRTKPSYDQYNIMNSFDQMSVNAEMERKGLLTSQIVNQSSSGMYGIMWNLIHSYDESKGQFGLENTKNAREAFLYKYAFANTDWFDLLFRNSLIQNHSVSISAGTEKSKTYASVGFMNDAGWTVANDKVDRYTMSFRNDYTISKKVSTAFAVNGMYRSQDTPGTFGRQADVVTGEYNRDFDINPFSYALNTSRALRPYDENGNLEYTTLNYAPFNIFDELKYNRIHIDVADLRLQGELNYQIIKGLKYSFIGALRYVKTDTEHRVHEKSNAANAYRAAGNSTIREMNPYLYRDPNDPSAEPVVVLPYGGFYNRDEMSMRAYDVRNSLSYNKVFDNGVRTQELNVLGGVQAKFADRHFNSNSGYGYQYDYGGVVAIDPKLFEMLIARQFPYYSMTQTYDRQAAFYANADYTYDRRYSVSATFRYDGNNGLGSSSSARWLPTWNLGARWNIANEKFMENAEKVDVMGLRLSYGLSANTGLATNSSVVYRYNEVYRPGNTENGMVIEELENKDLTWEKNYQFNVGYDLTMFDGRLNFSLDYYNRQSFDLINLIKVSGIGGNMWKYANYCDLSAYGFDVTLGGTIIRTKDWSWTANLTFGYSHNEIKNAKNEPQVWDMVRQEGGNKNGYPVHSLFSIPFAGLDPDSGIPMFYDQDGNLTTDVYMQGTETDFLKYEGTVDPKYTGGLNTTVRWKNLSMNLFFSFAAGNVVRLDPVFRDTYSDINALPNDFKNRWVMSGDEKYTNIPSITDLQTASMELGNAYPYNNYNYSDVRVAKGDFIRLKSVSFAYDVPSSWIRKSHFFKSASIRVTGKDLWLLYSDKKLHGQDPEFYNSGGVAMPIQPQVVFSLDLGF